MNKSIFSYKDKFNLFLFLGPIITGISIFSILSFLLIPLRINAPISMVMTFLTFWLTKYYFIDNYFDKNLDSNKGNASSGNKNHVKSGTTYSKPLFFIIYCTFLIITFLTTYDSSIFYPWSEFNFADALKLVSAIGLSFFIPGYAVISIISRNNELGTILKCLLGYLTSVLVTGLCAYIIASFGIAVIDNKNLIIISYLTVLIVYTAFNYRQIFNKNLLNFSYTSIDNSIISISRNSTIIMVFIGLFLMQIILTYYLFNGTLFGDQWYHHGRALEFINGAFKDIYSTAPDYYPPLFTALISQYLVLSGNASVNAFVSVNFLIMPALVSFYFFAKKWMPIGSKKSALIATVLFMLGSGFGWIYVLQLATSQQLSSDATILEIFRIATIKSFDLNLANTFFATPHPSPHGSIALPAGFLLVGLLKVEFKSSLKYAFIFAVTTVGITSHDEFYLFILVNSILLLVYRLNRTHAVFAAMLSSIIFVFFVDMVLPVKYFTVIEIAGIPLMILSLGFVLATWAAYTANVLRLFGGIGTKIREYSSNIKRKRFVLTSIIVSVILYLYFFTFIVWQDLSIEQVGIQTDNYGQRDIPWYLFPMKLGIVGLFGLLFILSYFYKKFQREIFVFAILALIAFLAAPHYDEYRFGKYIMVGMIGFASLLIYRVISYLQTFSMRILVGGIFLGIIVTTSSLSVLMYSGFKEILIDNPSYRSIPGENNRFFPTNSEMKLFSMLKNHIINLKTDNIAVLSNESGNGLLSEKLMGFVGIPYQKIYHSPLILNASSLAAFFEFVESDDIRYIIISQSDLNASRWYTIPTQFALSNFPRIYEDDNYLVLKVPKLVGPNPNPQMGLVYDPLEQVAISQSSYLPYNQSSYPQNESGHVQIKENGNIILLNNETEPITVLTNSPDQKINLIDIDFKILQENKAKNIAPIDWKTDTSFYQQEASTRHAKNNLGLKWTEDTKEYTLLLTTAGLELTIKGVNGSNLKLQNQEIFKESLKWYNIKILLLKKEIIIFVNKVPRFQIERTDENIDSKVSKIGIVAHGNNAEFLPIRVKQVSDLDNKYYNNSKSINKILSFLAMSNSSYGLFLPSDLSITSKKTVILPLDTTDISSDNLNRYLEYVSTGGTIVVFNSENKFDGIFAKFFAINSSNLMANFSKVTFIQNNHQNDINISGIAKVLKIPQENGLKVLSFYSDKSNNNISPFAIEKKFSNGGRVVFVNNRGLFDSLASNNKPFSNITDISKLLNINFNDNISKTNSDKFKSNPQFTKLEKFVGQLELNGKININSSSMILYNGTDNTQSLDLKVQRLVLSNNTKQMIFNNVTIKDLKLYGQYKVQLNTSGFISLPSTNSYYDYIDLHVPIDSPLKIRLVPEKYGGASISLINQSMVNIYNFTNNLDIEIQKSSSNINSNGLIDILTKSPEIEFTGSTIIDSADFSNVLLSGNRYLKINGTISAKFDHVDDYYEKRDDLLESRPVTYLKDINISGKTNPDVDSLGIMGDISYRARNHDVGVPLEKIFISTQNLILIIAVLIICFFFSKLIWSRRLTLGS